MSFLYFNMLQHFHCGTELCHIVVQGDYAAPLFCIGRVSLWKKRSGINEHHWLAIPITIHRILFNLAGLKRFHSRYWPSQLVSRRFCCWIRPYLLSIYHLSFVLKLYNSSFKTGKLCPARVGQLQWKLRRGNWHATWCLVWITSPKTSMEPEL